MILARKREVRGLAVGTDILPSEAARLYVQLPSSGGNVPFTFKDRRYLLPVYDTDALSLLLMCGRQTGKSSLLGNKTLIYSVLRRNFMSLYVAPTQIQVGQFSKDRIREPLWRSSFLRPFIRTGRGATDRVNHIDFATGSEVRLRQCFHNADRIRGLMTDLLTVDEFQDILLDHLDVIEETLFTSKYRLKVYAGTPKSWDSSIAQYWDTESTKNEWAIPCERHTSVGPVGAVRVHLNIVSEKSIPDRPEDGMVCDKCRKPIQVLHPGADWVTTQEGSKNAEFLGYRVPQVIDPNCSWEEVLKIYREGDRKSLFNEKLALPYDIGTRPLSREELRKHCHPDVSIYSDDFAMGPRWALERRSHPVFMGLDWGSGVRAFSYVVIGSYFGTDRMRICYFQRFVGEEVELEPQLDAVCRLIEKYNVRLVGADYGYGHDRNDVLLRRFGANRFFRYQYADVANLVQWNSKLGYFQCKRTEAMSMTFAAIRRGVFLYPRQEEMEGEGNLGEEMLNIHSETQSKTGKLIYGRAPNKTDDGFQACLYMLLASSIMHPRPDLFVPGAPEHS